MLSKLIPLLASDKDGEVVATAHAISRVLKASGCDWHDLVARNFITNIAWSRRKPTERQMQWLRDIADRLRGPA